MPVSPSKKSELIALLTTGPSPNSSTAAAGTIRPKGVVNSGNMCYANSVLQLLVYCTPFQRLFAELGKLLSSSSGSAAVSGPDSLVNGSAGPSSSSTSISSSGSTTNGLNGKVKEKDKDAGGMTPLVDATVEFLREFMDDKKTTKSKTKKHVHSKKASLTNGNGVARKGKEKETMNGVVDDDSGGGEVD